MQVSFPNAILTKVLITFFFLPRCTNSRQLVQLLRKLPLAQIRRSRVHTRFLDDGRVRPQLCHRCSPRCIPPGLVSARSTDSGTRKTCSAGPGSSYVKTKQIRLVTDVTLSLIMQRLTLPPVVISI